MEKKVKQISLKQRYNLDGRDIEEFIEDAYFIQGKDYVDFLTEQGYKVAGLCKSREPDENNNMVFKPMDDNTSWLDGALILIGDNEDREGYSDGLCCKYVENNPFVKRISMSLTEFKIRLVSKYYRWEKIEEDNVYAYVIKGDLEKDLSMEWIKFLADRYLEYEQYMLERYKWVKINASQYKQEAERLIAKRIANIDENKIKEAIANQQRIIDKSDYITNMLTREK